MHDFQYQAEELCCEGVPVSRIADEVGTPFYLYSRKTLERHFKIFDSAFGRIPHLTCYSVKANSNLTVLRIFAKLGAGVDVVSGGEIYRALQAGIDPQRIVYSGVGKTRREIDEALQANILQFNVESAQELELIEQAAAARGNKARVALRINPDVDPQTHPYISTGLKQNKFGVGLDDALEAYKRAAACEHIEVTGVACHIGSQITKVGPFVDALRRVKVFIGELESQGISVRHLDLGGGLGITYRNEAPPLPTEYAQAIIQEMEEMRMTLILEPGRVIVGNAGILVARVLYTKQGQDRHFIVVDAAMNDLVRPSLYGAYHEILSVRKPAGPRPHITADVVGPICESGDFMAKARKVEPWEPGECIAVMSAGAYGFTMSSNYNSRPRVPEVLADGDSYTIIRLRETYADLVAGEHVPENL